MTPEEVQSILVEGLEGAEVFVEGDGNHFQVTAVSNQFEGLRAVPRQQIIYGLLGEYIKSGVLHAIGIKTYTESEWKSAKKFQIG
ncbi:MAG: acid stress-induced BolA-like protein IbaG/YrbA [Enterobacterales bacterium]|jgi:acid stress-induced BolA-like protein IbaG/YrbA